MSPAVHSDLWKDSFPWKVGFSASTKCLRIRAQSIGTSRSQALCQIFPLAETSTVILYLIQASPVPELPIGWNPPDGILTAGQVHHETVNLKNT